MSRPDIQLILSPQAEEDFTDILQYTLETRGEAQVHVYGSILDKALLTIQQYPQIGHALPEISEFHRMFSAGRHTIIYLLREHNVYVSRILHERMNIARHL
jgi:toxin ParE1/3/4